MFGGMYIHSQPGNRHWSRQREVRLDPMSIDGFDKHIPVIQACVL